MKTWAIASFAVLVFSIPAPSQVPGRATRNSDFSMRFSYESTWVTRGTEEEVPRVCFALARDGQYRLLRTKGVITEAFQGVLTSTQRELLQSMLGSTEFRNLSGNGSGLIRNGAETFIAQLPAQGEERNVVWTNRDRQQPFPQPAAEMIDWMKNFDVSGGQQVRHDVQGVCPVSVKPLVPAS